ncbi:putative UPF0481 protein At3g02645 [Juglans microcarpa x Juglans regia]|uniref:putative UPF0481 protein At3g02645 n=1 Tax=Juglans microcarpa x Juglans regia TaxID=2249226 RepID=UPI001B7EBF69|nr:putative UPF0481 protein At3g02645 [Juglans microcarpa x Juglans regia]XP_041019957.1 putative UPF0481 protein At3g02645 [Juglans microcarpa x Juglans regia]
MDRSINNIEDDQELSHLFVSLREKLERIPSISSDCCIFRVPKRLRELNEKAYTPRVVSIGPLHHDNEDLRAMEVPKLRYLKNFLLRTNVSMEDYLNLLKGREERLRNSYGEPIKLTSNEFLEMILVDAAFVIEVMLQYHSPNKANYNGYHFILGNRSLIKDVKYDMLLLENQLPFFILEELFLKARIIIPPEHDERLSLIRLTHHVFETQAYLEGVGQPLGKICLSEIEHFVHFIRICQLPQTLPPKGKLRTVSIPSATQLHQTGVKFKVASTGNLYDLRFKNGVLEIPHLRVRGSTESLFGNLIAFEQCRFDADYISDYLFVMDRLIETRKDVEVLVRNGIIESKLLDSKGVVTFIKHLVPGTIMRGKKFYFTDVCEDLNAHCNVLWNKWKVTLREDYFSSPWAVLSITAAATLLLLTSIQTVCSIISL